MEIIKVIAVTFAVSLSHGNGRSITSNNNDSFERMLDLVEEEINSVLNETNDNPAKREENPAVFRLSESNSSSHKAIQSHFSSDNMIQQKEASPVLRQKRSHLGPCYDGSYQTVELAIGGVKAFPICKKVTLTGCASSARKYGKRKCKGADYETVRIRSINGANQLRAYPKKCTCFV